MIGMLLLRIHARRSNHPLKNRLSKDDFAILLAIQDGCRERLYKQRRR